ncbi:MAG: peptide chain release factor N(5)-glutamine methyltransferase [Betaproteobacteria bacterium]|nr:peptide chain release factor N(5)-glutamine methyltransferase [Betaproteobacteria bacterium]
MTITEALRDAALRIERRDAEVLLGKLLQCNRAFLIAHGQDELDTVIGMRFESWVTRREQGEPVAYITGTREFYGREFCVSPAVLIPRPETEHLIEQALARLSSPYPSELRTSARILDMGTGSGAIAVTLALERPQCVVTACDVSTASLTMAAENAVRLGAHVEFIQSDWYAALTGRTFDLIVSNPPYVAAHDAHLSQGDLRFEPTRALTDESVDGLASIRHIVEGAHAHLAPGGWLLFEHGYDQAGAARDLLLIAGFEDLICEKDLAGIPRVSGGRLG